MANRAYLYSMPNESGWWEYADERDYFDSRWNIPVCWWLLFDTGAFRTVEQHDGEWQEVRLARGRNEALAAFELRLPLVRNIIRDRVPENRLLFFVDVIRNWNGSTLALEPDEVLGGFSFSDAENAENFRLILDHVEQPRMTTATLLDVTKAYSPIGEDPDHWELEIFGYTYGELANAKWQQHCESSTTEQCGEPKPPITRHLKS